jgi:hypothetical protein
MSLFSNYCLIRNFLEIFWNLDLIEFNSRLIFGAVHYAKVFPLLGAPINAGTAKILRAAILATRSTVTSKITCCSSTTIDWVRLISLGRS